jgi:hypothetical protein
MSKQPLFKGLVIDENENPVDISYVGDEACYVVNDSGFRRHIPAEDVDRQVLDFFKSQVEGNEGLLAEQTSKMLGQEDPFSRAMIENQFKQLDQQFDQILASGIPEDGRAYMGMMGFRIVINYHGEVIRIDQPGTISGEEDNE